MSGGEEGKLSVRVGVVKAALCVLGSALFVVSGLGLCSAFFVSVLSPDYGVSLTERVLSGLFTSVYLVIGLASVLFFGYALIFFAGRLLLFWRPVLEVGPEGILDRASALGAGPVPWEEIRDVRPVTMRGQSFIAIEVRDEQKLLERQNPVKRLAMRINRRYFTGAAINIPQVVLSVPQREILAHIEPYLSPAARERLSGLRAKRERMPSGYRRRRITSGDVPGIVLGVLQWLWATALTLFLLLTGAMLGLFGGIVGWSGLRAVFGLGSGQGEWWHAPTGAIMIACGAILILRLTPMVRRLSGREPPSNM